MDQETVRAFASRVNSGDLGPDLQVRYHVAGGMPSQRLELHVQVDSVNGAQVSRYDASTSQETTTTSISPDRFDFVGLLRAVSRGMHTLTPASEAVAFLADSLVGRLTIVVEGREEEFYFVPEREKRSEETKVAPAMEVALQQFWELALPPSRRTGRANRA